MRKTLSFGLGVAIGVFAATNVSMLVAIGELKKLSNGAQCAIDGVTMRVQFWSPEIVRVTYAATNELPELKSLSVVAKEEKVGLKRAENDQAFILSSASVTVKIDKQSGEVSFLDSTGNVLLQEKARGRRFTPGRIAADAVTSVAQTFETAADEGIYG